MATTNINALKLDGKTLTTVSLPAGTPADVTNGNSSTNNGMLRILVDNTGDDSDTVSVTRSVVIDGASLPTHDFPVAAGAKVIIGPFPTEVFGPTLKYKATAATTLLTPLAV